MQIRGEGAASFVSDDFKRKINARLNAEREEDGFQRGERRVHFRRPSALCFVNRSRRVEELGDSSIFHLESQRRTVSRSS